MIIEGVYIVNKLYSNVRMEKRSDKSVEGVEFFTFKDHLYHYFDFDTVEKIIERICENKKLILDFTNKKVFLIKEAKPNFTKIFMQKEMTAEVVQEFYDLDGNMYDTNYMRTILGDDRNAEPLP